MIDPDLVRSRVAELRAEIARRTDRAVTLVAVTKTFGIDAVQAAVAAGVDAIGENYAQELRDKYALWKPGAPRQVPWHFIGRLQRNKIKVLSDAVSLWETIDRIELVDELARRAPGAALLVQVNCTGEAQKGGCEPGAVAALVAHARAAGLDTRGLMTVGVADDDARTQDAYRLLRSLADDLGLVDCSMGMSGDYPIALAEGATIIRIGSLLFGPRQAERPMA